VLYSTILYNTVLFGTVTYNTVQYYTVIYPTVLGYTVRYSDVQYCAVTLLYCDVPPPKAFLIVSLTGAISANYSHAIKIPDSCGILAILDTSEGGGTT